MPAQPRDRGHRFAAYPRRSADPKAGEVRVVQKHMPEGWRPENMFLERIGRLASLRLQERFITRATDANYYVVEELLDEAVGVVDALLELPGYGERLSNEARQALREFDRALQEDSDRVDYTSHDFVLEDAAWSRIRATAAACLSQVEFKLAEFEVKELATVGE